ncbi:hypothetical protein [Nonomuraea jiangxiensis]|uniref:Uncharacterized protein n=1 Tax=Nonomuraea jiangxiensis TaxID=633440 RepID=A0A1G9UFW4_9ACTN|nr:hypothetical protein [Nonomuraea jiangxiensis]SDM58812.1 hypothetical protein SAMN05421869_14837 [Nonomuraea jiangxiensis]
MNIGDRVRTVLGSPRKEKFLLALGHRLGIAARGVFTGDASQAARQAQACNEMMIAIWSQMWAMKTAGPTGHPDREFLAILLEKADAGDARLNLLDALNSALLSMGGDDLSEQETAGS